MICVKTGKAVESGVKPIKQWMRPKYLWSIVLPLLVIYGFGGGLYYLGVINEGNLNRYTVLFMIVLVSIGIRNRKTYPKIFFYCDGDLARKISRDKKIYGGFLYGGIIFMNLSMSLDWHPSVTILCGMLIFISAIKIPKKLLKSLGREGDYERFEGVHADFLDALPDHSAQEGGIEVS